MCVCVCVGGGGGGGGGVKAHSANYGLVDHLATVPYR